MPPIWSETDRISILALCKISSISVQLQIFWRARWSLSFHVFPTFFHISRMWRLFRPPWNGAGRTARMIPRPVAPVTPAITSDQRNLRGDNWWAVKHDARWVKLWWNMVEYWLESERFIHVYPFSLALFLAFAWLAASQIGETTHLRERDEEW